MSYFVAQAGLLAFAQLGAGLQDQVLAIERLEQRLGERAASRAEFQDPAAGNAGELARKRAAEKIAELGRGDEVALRSEFACPARVVAEPGLVQCELHVARERDPAAFPLDLLGDALARRHAGNLP